MSLLVSKVTLVRAGAPSSGARECRWSPRNVGWHWQLRVSSSWLQTESAAHCIKRYEIERFLKVICYK